MGGRGSYSFFDHTADVGVDVAAPTLEGLFETAAAALFELLVEAGELAPRVDRHVTVKGTDHEELLVRWLAELLYLHNTEGLLFARFRISDLSGGRLVGMASGELYDPSRHRVKTEIKAVTYHQVSVKRDDGVWRARVVFDV